MAARYCGYVSGAMNRFLPVKITIKKHGGWKGVEREGGRQRGVKRQLQVTKGHNYFSLFTSVYQFFQENINAILIECFSVETSKNNICSTESVPLAATYRDPSSWLKKMFDEFTTDIVDVDI